MPVRKGFKIPTIIVPTSRVLIGSWYNCDPKNYGKPICQVDQILSVFMPSLSQHHCYVSHSGSFLWYQDHTTPRNTITIQCNTISLASSLFDRIEIFWQENYKKEIMCVPPIDSPSATSSSGVAAAIVVEKCPGRRMCGRARVQTMCAHWRQRRRIPELSTSSSRGPPIYKGSKRQRWDASWTWWSASQKFRVLF